MKIVKEVIEQIHSAVDNYQKTGVMPRASDMDHWADRLKEVFVTTETKTTSRERNELRKKIVNHRVGSMWHPDIMISVRIGDLLRLLDDVDSLRESLPCTCDENCDSICPRHAVEIAEQYRDKVDGIEAPVKVLVRARDHRDLVVRVDEPESREWDSVPGTGWRIHPVQGITGGITMTAGELVGPSLWERLGQEPPPELGIDVLKDRLDSALQNECQGCKDTSDILNKLFVPPGSIYDRMTWLWKEHHRVVLELLKSEQTKVDKPEPDCL